MFGPIHCQPCPHTYQLERNIPFHTERESRTLVGNILAMGFRVVVVVVGAAAVDKFVVLLLPRPRRHYGKVQGCAALIDRRVSRDLGNAEGTRKLLFATDLYHNLILYVIIDAILTIQSVINPRDHN